MKILHIIKSLLFGVTHSKKIKYSSKDIAFLIFKGPVNTLKALNLPFSDAEKFFFAAELSFYMFFLIAGDCMKDNLCKKDCLMAIEHELAETWAKALQGSSDDYKNIIRNRFTAYKSVISVDCEGRSTERQDIFLHMLNNDKKNDGFCSVTIPNPMIPVISNPFYRIAYAACMKESFVIIGTVIDQIKKRKT